MRALFSSRLRIDRDALQVSAASTLQALNQRASPFMALHEVLGDQAARSAFGGFTSRSTPSALLESYGQFATLGDIKSVAERALFGDGEDVIVR